MKPGFKSLLLLPLLLAVAATTRGDVGVVNLNYAPTENIILQQIPDGDVDFDFSFNSDYEIGQSFLAPEEMTVTDITISFSKFQPGAVGKSFDLKVYETGGPTDAPSESNLISSQAGNFPMALEPNTFLTFTLEEPLALKKDQWYVIMLVSKGAETGMGFPLRATNTEGSNTFTWQKSDADYNRYTTRSLTIYLQGKKGGG